MNKLLIVCLLAISSQTLVSMWSPSDPLILEIRNASSVPMKYSCGDLKVKIAPDSYKRVPIGVRAFIDTPNATYRIFVRRIENLLEIRFDYDDEDEYTEKINKLSDLVGHQLVLDNTENMLLVLLLDHQEPA